MQDLEYSALFEDIKLPKEIKSRFDKIYTQPEGEVEVRWVHRLVSYYMYSINQIALQVPAGAGRNAAKSAVFADIVVYRDKAHKEPFIVVEVKKPNTAANDGVGSG